MSRPNPAQEPSMDRFWLRSGRSSRRIQSARHASPTMLQRRHFRPPLEHTLIRVSSNCRRYSSRSLPRPNVPRCLDAFPVSTLPPVPSSHSAASASLPAASSSAADARSKAVDAEISDLVESDLGDLLAETPAVLPPPAPGVPLGAVTHPIFPPVELLSVEPEAAAPNPGVPAPAALKSRLDERLANLGAESGRDYLGNEMGRNEPAAAPLDARPKNRDEAIATALGSLIPTKAEQANPASRLPPLGPLNETSAFSAIRPGARRLIRRRPAA